MTRCTYCKVAVIRAWTAHNASYNPGEEYQVPEFIAAILKRGGYAEIVSAAVVEVVEVQEDLWS